VSTGQLKNKGKGKATKGLKHKSQLKIEWARLLAPITFFEKANPEDLK